MGERGTTTTIFYYIHLSIHRIKKEIIRFVDVIEKIVANDLTFGFSTEHVQKRKIIQSFGVPM